MKKRIIYSLFISAIIGIIVYAVMCPKINLKKLEPVGEPCGQAVAYNGKIITAGTISEDGKVDVSSEVSCVVEYTLDALDVRCIRIDFANEVSSNRSFAIEITEDGSFTDKAAVYAKMYAGDSSACIELENGRYKAIRIWFSEDCAVEGIYYYSALPKAVGKPIKTEPWRYAAVAVISTLIFVAVFLFDFRFSFYERTAKILKLKKSRIIFFCVGVLTCLMASAVLELILRAVIGVDSCGKVFNMASFSIFAIITMVVFLFFFERKNIATRPEKFVAFMILVTGLLIIFTEPFSHNSSDEDRHYYWAVSNSFYGQAYLTDADYCVRNTVDFSVAGGHSLKASSEKVPLMNERDQYATQEVAVQNSLPHRTAGFFIAVARLFGASFRTKFICGQLGMLLIYVATVYFAVKRLKSGKMIMSVIALFPTNILLASNYSYDAWVTGFALLGTAYFVSEIEQPEKPITVRDTVIMCGSLLLAALPKQVYVVLMLLPVFMKKKWYDKRQKQRYFIILLGFFALMFTLFVMRSVVSVTGGGDARGGEVDSMGQFIYILKNPFEYAVILIKFLIKYLSPVNAKGYITFFSYLGNGKSAFVYILVLLFCVFTDKNEMNRFKGYNFIKIITIIFDFALVCMIATALYIVFTPVGHETINGCNPRYIIPLIAPLALTVGNPGIRLKISKATYNFVVLSIISASLVFDVLTVITIPML